MAETKNTKPDTTNEEVNVAASTSADLENLAVAATSDTARADIQALNAGSANIYSSFTGGTFADKLGLVQAISNSEPIADNLKKDFRLRNIIAQPLQMVNEQTGQLDDVTRIVVVDEDGKALHGISNGLYKSIETLLSIVGHPATWDGAIPVQFERRGEGTRKYFTMVYM